MISDGDLYRLAIFLGSASMVLIVLYHFLEINSSDAAQKVEGGKGASAKKQSTN
ncbi:Oligosaccaryltransferase-domain-containing protein [Ilyonectria sp. MPI-CAGE-AT-0026]|nr:Oligosaccaryltransferase-domain-containing protein [Ilyonectria sp. MPI-CAGE-AT-0026]